MAEEETIAQDSGQSEAKPTDGKSDLMMYLIVGAGALVVTIGVMVAFGDMSGSAGHGGSNSADDLTYEESEFASEESSQEGMDLPDLFSELDNLDFLGDTEFAAGSSDANELESSINKAAGKPDKMSKEDSLAALSWLEKEKALLNERESAVSSKEKKIAAREHEVDQKLKKVDQIEANRLSGLAKLYDGMKHDQVARMIVKLNDETIVQILPRMKTANASKILGLLPADRGARISKKMITLSSK